MRIYGHNLDILRSKAEEVRQLLAGIDGLAEPIVEDQVEEPVVEIEVDLEKAQRYGIKPGDVRRAEAALLSGLHVGDLFEEQKVFEVVVWGTPETRESLTSIRELLIDTPGGGHVRLGDVADVRIVPNLNVIQREAVSRRLDVEASVHDRDPVAVAAEVDRRLSEIQWPLEYHAEVLGNYAERQAARNRLLAFALAAAVGTFLLLQACFGSWRLATLAFLALPAALAGGVLAAALGGRHALARFARRISRGVGDRGASRHHADQALSASRATRRRDLRSRAGLARGTGAVCADLDHRGHDRSGLPALGAVRRYRRSRDSAPDGRCRSGWARHFDIALSVRRTCPVLVFGVQP